MGPPPVPHLPDTFWSLSLVPDNLLAGHAPTPANPTADTQHVLGIGAPSSNEIDIDLQYE